MSRVSKKVYTDDVLEEYREKFPEPLRIQTGVDVYSDVDNDVQAFIKQIIDELYDEDIR